MLILCVLVLIAFGVDTLAPLGEDARLVLLYADTFVCGFFLIDFVVTLWRADSKLRYFATWGWLDLISSIPMVGVLRVGRAARMARIIRVFRGLRSTRVVMQHALKRRAESALYTAVLLTLIVVVFASIAVVRVEAPAGGNITTGQDAMWWAIVTISTAGFGDLYPITTEGRIIAAGLMAVGIGMFGTFTAFLATWFLRPGEHEQDADLHAIREEIAALRREVGAGS
jgi:voltage-gated potassium channel